MYVQLASALRERIRRGEIPVGRRIPSHHELEQETGGTVSRRTIKSAIEACRPRESFKGSLRCPPRPPRTTRLATDRRRARQLSPAAIQDCRQLRKLLLLSPHGLCGAVRQG
ncbi:GntR family transcriptional regulator [Streptomyces sp. NBC_00287]